MTAATDRAVTFVRELAQMPPNFASRSGQRIIQEARAIIAAIDPPPEPVRIISPIGQETDAEKIAYLQRRKAQLVDQIVLQEAVVRAAQRLIMRDAQELHLVEGFLGRLGKGPLDD